VRATCTLAASTLGALAAVTIGSPATGPILGTHGVARVEIGAAKSKAVAELSQLFGRPSATGVNTGCGPRYSEVEWGDLVAEFRRSRFSGFRYVKGGYPLTTSGSPHEASALRAALLPKLATSRGITLGSTLGQLRKAYPALRFVGTDRWQSPDGLVFVDDAKPIAKPRLRHIIEIKLGTCGDF